MKKLKGIDGKLDTAWAVLVKLMAGNMCERCKKTKPLNSHHIYSRSKRSVRWHPDNGVCLCVGCHVFSSKFSAHKTPIEFIDWLRQSKTEAFIDKLRLKAHTISKLHPFEKELLLKDLNKQIKKLS